MATTLHSPHRRHTPHLPHPHWGERARAGPWLIAVGIAVCLAVVVAGLAATDTLPGVSGDDASERTQVQAYYVPGQGDGLLSDALLSDAHRAIAAPTQLEPISRYEMYLGEGWLGRGFNPGDIRSAEEQARLANDEVLFDARNDPLDWQTRPNRPTVLSREDMLMLEQNGVYADTADLSYLERLQRYYDAKMARLDELEGRTTVATSSVYSYECTTSMDRANCLEHKQNTTLPTSGTDDGLPYDRQDEELPR